MPHVVIEGELDLAAWAGQLEPLLLRRGGDVMRTTGVYLERGAGRVLVEALAVEAGRKMPFYVQVARHDRGRVTVRVDPTTHPDRSDAVREIVGQVAASLLAHATGARVARANIVVPSVAQKRGEPQ